MGQQQLQQQQLQQQQLQQQQLQQQQQQQHLQQRRGSGPPLPSPPVAPLLWRRTPPVVFDGLSSKLSSGAKPFVPWLGLAGVRARSLDQVPTAWARTPSWKEGVR